MKRLTKQQREEQESLELKNYKTTYDKIGRYLLLISGLIFLFIGLFLTITDSVSIGSSLPGRMGVGGGQPRALNGPFTLFLAFVFLLGAFWDKLKEIRNKKK